MKTQRSRVLTLFRKQHRKKAFGFLLALFLVPVFVQAVMPASWILDTTVNGVEFYHSIQECNGKKAVFLKFNNRNTYQVKVSWKEVFATQQEAKVEGGKGQKELIIPTGVTVPASCTDNMMSRKNIVLSSEVSPMYVAEIRGYSFKDIQVTKTK